MDINNQPLRQLKDFLILCAVLLAVLFSSCSVRKTLYTKLNIPVTKPLNTSKSTLTTNSVCKAVAEINSRTSNKEVKKDVGLPLLPTLSGQPFRLIVVVEKLNRGLSNVKSSDHIPLYILYQNRKIIT